MTSASATADAAAEERKAVIAGIGCYAFWGFLPLLFKASAWAGAGPWEIVAWRTFWAFLAATAVVAVSRGWGKVADVLRTPGRLGLLLCAAILIISNWSLFIWAVDAGHTLDASLGYYLNPLMSVAAGMLLFRERIGTAGWIAIALAGAGVAVQTLAQGGLPLAALGMATTFCVYGILKKHIAVDAPTGLFIECAVLAAPALAYGLMLQSAGLGHMARPLSGFLLAIAGPATVAPLITFAWAARRMPLSSLGFIQFIAPTTQFVIGVAFGEPLPPLSLLAFAFIWSGVAVYAFTAWRKTRGIARTA
jgi:chloramphenicol-sensitive protein RarD